MPPPPFLPPPAYMAPKRDFIGKPAPPGYVAGIGRGATGFTTRSDIGPARGAAVAMASTSGIQSKSGQGTKRRGDDDDDEEEEDLNESNYDEFAGYGGSLFSKDPYENDDEEADKTYAEIDRRLDERGKALREAKMKLELEEYRQKRPKIQQQFSEDKAKLALVSEEEWMNIPEVGDARNRKQRVARQDKFTPVPDSLLAHQAKLATGGDKVVYLDPKRMANQDDDDDDDNDNSDNKQGDNKTRLLEIGDKDESNKTSGLSIGDMSDLRSSWMVMQLSRASNNAQQQQQTAETKQTSESTNTEELRNYLTNLNSTNITTQITDTTTLEEYRKQFKALRTSNPRLEMAWIASVRLEEAAGKLSEARSLILAALERCPKKADLWLEAIRLHPPNKSKSLMVAALKEVPRSEKLWIKAAEMENNEDSRRRVYTKACQMIPKSILLWKKSIELEPPDKARVLLRKAVEFCPNAVDFWIALARLEDYEEAKKVLDEASKKNPTDRSIWITAAKLEEHVGDKNKLVKLIIRRAVEELSEKGMEIKRQDWLDEAMLADRAGFKATSREIVRNILSHGVPDDSETRLAIWMGDIRRFVEERCIDCARAVFSCLVEHKDFCKSEQVWKEYAKLEQQQQQTGDDNSKLLVEVLTRAVQPENCRKSESLWLLLVDAKRSNLEQCRQILSSALDANPESEKIVLAAVELECEKGNHDEARRILTDAKKSAQLVLRAAKLEWSLGKLDKAHELLASSVGNFTNWPDFYLNLGQLEEERGEKELARKWYENGLKFNPKSVQLWISLARVKSKLASARSILEEARRRIPCNVQLWLEAAQLEWKQFVSKSAAHTTGRPDIVATLLAKGISECKNCPDVDKLFEMQSMIGGRNKR